MALTKLEKRNRIKRRIRGNGVYGTATNPRLSVFRSNKQISAQIINDDDGKTLVAVSSLDKAIAEVKDSTKVAEANLVGKLLAEKAIAAGISTVIFDRNGYIYHGRVKSLGDAAREGGLKF